MAGKKSQKRRVWSDEEKRSICAQARVAETANTRGVLETRITIGLARRAAKALILGAPSGRSRGDDDGDLAKVTRIAAAMEDGLGPGETLKYLSPNDCAADRHRIDSPQHKIVEGQLTRGDARATRILEANRAPLIELATVIYSEGILQDEAPARFLSAVIRKQAGDGATRHPDNCPGPVRIRTPPRPLSPTAVWTAPQPRTPVREWIRPLNGSSCDRVIPGGGPYQPPARFWPLDHFGPGFRSDPG